MSESGPEGLFAVVVRLKSSSTSASFRRKPGGGAEHVQARRGVAPWNNAPFSCLPFARRGVMSGLESMFDMVTSMPPSPFTPPFFLSGPPSPSSFFRDRYGTQLPAISETDTVLSYQETNPVVVPTCNETVNHSKGATKTLLSPSACTGSRLPVLTRTGGKRTLQSPKP
jgi:hypothetical protein